MKKLAIWGLTALALAGLLGLFSGHFRTRLSERENVLQERGRLTEEAKIISEKRVESASQKLATVSRLEGLEKFSEELTSLPKAEREALAPILRAKLFEANFLRAEALLESAGGLLRSDENHPTGKEYLEQARKIYEKMAKLLEQGIAEKDDPAARARLNYLKGVFYFRSLIFVKDPKAEASRVEELVGQSAQHLSEVFKYFPRDRDTEVALEILQKKAEKMGAGKPSDAKLQLELLPSRGSRKGPGFAIEGDQEGIH